MAASLRFKTVLDDVIQAGQEVEVHLQKERDRSNGTTLNLPDNRSELGLPLALESSRKNLANAAAKLLQLTIDPTEYIEQLSANVSSISYTDLATKANVPEDQLKSVIRMTVAHGFICEDTPMNVSHSCTSALFAKDPNFANWARWFTNYSVPTAYRFADATQKWGKTTETNETAFNIAMDAGVPFFDYLKENSRVNTMFSLYMRNIASSEATSFKHMITGFDWANLGPHATVVDVGGSRGHGSRALASAFPDLKFIVQDLPDTIKIAEAALAGDPELQNDRIKFMAHNFLTPQPVTDADVYFLRMIIHDWPDSSVITILGHLRDALKKPGAKVVIMDTILPKPGTIALLQERQLRVRDLTMMQTFNAKEREYDDWKALVEQSGLEILKTHQPEGSNMGLLEIGLPGCGTSKAGVNTFLEANGVTRGSSVSPSISAIETENSNGLIGADGLSSGSVSQSASNDIGPNISTHCAGSSTRVKTKQDAFPVLIMGAGISGLCLAQHLQRYSIPFLVFERDPSPNSRPQGYRLKLEADAAAALRESLAPEVYDAFEASCAESYIGETDFDPISGACVRSRSGGGLAGNQGLRTSYTVDRSIFRLILMSGITDKIHFGHELYSYEIRKDKIQSYVVVTFKDGTTFQGRFLAGADGTRSVIRKQLAPQHRYLDTGAICIYGKTNITPELSARFPARGLRWMTACADKAPLIQSILIGESPLTLLSEPIRFSGRSRISTAVSLPDNYVYWVLIGRKELFTDGGSENASSPTYKAHMNSDKEFDTESARASAAQSLALTEEWHPSLRSLFELQDESQASTMRVVSSPPRIPLWESNAYVTLLGDAVHAMSPCGGVGANVALRDAAELGKLLVGMNLSPESGTEAHDSNESEATGQHSTVKKVADFEEGVRQRALAGIMRSYTGSRAMFDQKPFEDLQVLED
ncbi:hypothetical protein GQ44DRAFT_674326 [Phaeosphaeriaceae sp. PMI808]|nr:hypothetical protein GQ44DRAFT_674326 [Phaeosphaeriaceae sp. PMI808]